MKNDILNYFDDFGYKKFGPFLLMFSKWLLNELKSKSIMKVYFFSRDGLILKEVFDSINNEEIKSYYFYASRRAIIVPSLISVTKVEDLFQFIAFNKIISVKSFIKKIGLEDLDLDFYLNKYSISLNDNFDIDVLKYENDSNFYKFVNDLIPLIVNNSQKEKDSFENYIKKMDFNGTVAIVDIGWFGSMQNSLNKILPGVEIFGYYIGLVPTNGFYNNEFSKGYLFDSSHGYDDYLKVKFFINILEFLFLAQHGSVKKYISSCDVEFYDYEYEGLDEALYAKQIQKSALQFIKNNKSTNINFSNDEFINYFLYPSKISSKFWGNILFKDDEFLYIAKPQKITKYIFDISLLKKDFIKSAWRIGFLKRLLIIPLPYFKINLILRKIFIKNGE